MTSLTRTVNSTAMAFALAGFGFGCTETNSPDLGGDDAGALGGASGATPTISAGGTSSAGSSSAGGAGPPPIGAGGASGAAGSSPADAGPSAPLDAADDAMPIAEPPPSLVGDVAFSVPSQSFRGEIAVTMTTTLPSAEIRYTTDGELPTTTSPQFSGVPLTVSSTTQLRAQAFVAGVATGSPSTAIYVARTFEATSDLPLVIVDGYGGGKPTDKDVYLDAAIMIFEPTGGTASFEGLPTVATRAGYHIRGQSSARFPQASYRIELWNNADEDEDYEVLGMPAEADWALVAPYYDRALIRNPLVYELGSDLGLEAPRVRFAEVYINYEDGPVEETDYEGIYWVTETIKNNRVRTNLKQLRETDTMLPDISGGYIFKFDQAAAEEPRLECTGSPPISSRGGGGGGGGTCWTDLEVVDPDPLNMQQEAWLTSYIQDFHDTLHQTPLGDYAAYMDVASFVDYLIINELTRNVDAYVRSAFYHKDRDGKLKAGPLWDYNFALAVGGSGSIDPQGGWQFEGSRDVSNWYPVLTKDPAFMNQVKARYATLRQSLLSDAALEQRIAALATPLTNAAVRDFQRWPVEQIIEPGAFVKGPSAPTWSGQLDALREFVKARLAWMDARLQ